MKRALVIGSGGLTGAYSAGRLYRFCREVGPDYFDTIYASSVPVYLAAFLASHQLEIILETWGYRVDGRQLVNVANVLRRKPIMDLGYLIRSFQTEPLRLDLKAVFGSKTRMVYVLTERSSGRAEYVRPNSENIFQLMMASTAIPFLHPPVKIGEEYFADGALSDSLPVFQAMRDGYEDITVVTNKPKGKVVESLHPLFRTFLRLLPKKSKQILSGREARSRAVYNFLEQKRPGLTVMRPVGDIPVRHLTDTNGQRLRAALKMGIADAEKFDLPRLG